MALTEQRRIYLRKWRLKNLEKERERQRIWQQKWRKENPEKARKKDKLQHQRRAIEERDYQKNYRRKIDPIKLAARTILNNAIKLGKLKRPTKCENCNNPKIQAHHEDYNYPLKIKWLCSKCHAFVHHPY